MAQRRNAFFKNKTCVRCGSTDQLELDHVDQNTKANHRIWSWSVERRNAEITKCQILCHDCHVRKTTLNGERAAPTYGEERPNASLTNTQVLEAREIYARGTTTQVELAEQFGIPRSTMGHIIRGTCRWKSI
jgi:hypothetical protein